MSYQSHWSLFPRAFSWQQHFSLIFGVSLYGHQYLRDCSHQFGISLMFRLLLFRLHLRQQHREGLAFGYGILGNLYYTLELWRDWLIKARELSDDFKKGRTCNNASHKNSIRDAHTLQCRETVFNTMRYRRIETVQRSGYFPGSISYIEVQIMFKYRKTNYIYLGNFLIYKSTEYFSS